MNVPRIALLLALLISACSSGTRTEQAASVEQKPLLQTMLLTGEIRTAEAIELLAPMVGMWPIPIESILDDGSEVTEGQSVAEFDNSNLVGGLDRTRDQAEQARTSLLTTRARMNTEEADARFEVESKKLALDKATIEASIPEGLESQRERELAQLALRRAELEYATAQTKLANQLEKSRAEIGIAQVALDKALTEVKRTEQSLDVVVLRAPRDGVLEIAYNFEQGRPYRSGDNAQPGQPVALFPDYSTLRVEAFLFDVDEGSIQAGAETTIVLDAYPQRSFSGRVQAIQEVAQQRTPRSTRRAFRVLVEILEPDSAIMKVGMSARVEIQGQLAQWRGQPTLVVPRAALSFDPAEDGSARVQARLRTADGWIDAEVGRCSSSECIVLGPEAGTPVQYGPPEASGMNS